MTNPDQSKCTPSPPTTFQPMKPPGFQQPTYSCPVTKS